jgi:ABC-type branched-subunit amino acid transport system substrate-binding protein
MLVTALALVSGCGNRLSQERLLADVADTEVSAPVARSAQSNAGAPAETVRHAPTESPASMATGSVQATTTDVQGAQPAPAAAGPKPATGGKRTPAKLQNSAAGKAGPAVAVPPMACGTSPSPIRIGSVGENSGVAGSIFGPGAKVLQAWVQWINLRGGVACHPILLFVGDDGGDPATNQSLVQSFTEQKGVVAFVYMDAPFAGAASIKYLTEHQIPVFGSEGGEEWFNENPNYFPQMSSSSQYVEGAFAMAGATQVPLGRTKLASLTCIEAPICSAAYGTADGLSKKYGMTLVYRAQVSITSPNYTSNCLAAKNAGAQVVFTGLDGNTDQRVARSCASVDYHPSIVTPAVGLTPSQASDPALRGLQAAMPVLPWFQTDNKSIAEFAAALARFAPGVESSAVGVEAWVAGQVFALAASRVGDKPTSADILSGAYRIKDNDFGGLTERLTYTADAPNQKQRLCWWAAQFDGTKASSPNGGMRTCE